MNNVNQTLLGSINVFDQITKITYSRINGEFNTDQFCIKSDRGMNTEAAGLLYPTIEKAIEAVNHEITVGWNEELKKHIIDYWHISRTALAGNCTVPTRHDRMIYIRDTVKKYNVDLIGSLTSKQLWNLISDTTNPVG
jgi:hypothetical protein